MKKSLPIMKGNEIAVRCLELLGVDIVFAYPGGPAIAMHQALSKSSVRVILPRHEQGGAFAACGYARATGKVGVAMATSGPGATNLVSGIADAYMDSIPTVFITSQVSSDMIGKNVFQETDIIGMTRPVVKHSYLVLAPQDLPRIFKEAFHLARSGRPGPVVIDIPKNIQMAECEIDFDAEMDIPAYSIPQAPQDIEVEAIKTMIKESSRPCIYAGGGIVSAEASEELIKFAKSYNIPVTTTLMGIGIFPEDDDLSLRWLGMHGAVYANYAANECDLLIALGARFDDRVTGTPENFARSAKIIHVDIDDSEINKNKPATLGVIADVKQTLMKLNEKPVFNEYKEWFAQIDEWKKQFPLTYKRKANTLQPQYVIERISALSKGEATIVPGVGQHQMWAAQYYKYSRPRQLLTSGGLGAMGFGLPAAMGAKAACPDALIINIDGDGSFQMNIQELGTLKVEKLDVKMVILNNQHLGMVAQWEDRLYNSNRGNTVLGRCYGSCGIKGHNCEECDRGKQCTGEKPYPDFVTIAKGYEIPAREVYSTDELDDAITEMLNTPGPFLLDIHTGYEEHVLPFIPAGKDYKSVIIE